MIKLEILVRPKKEKYLEFSQSLKFIKSDLAQLCTSLQITQKDKSFTLIANLDSAEQLSKVLFSKELAILSGAIRMLGDKSEIIIHGTGYKKIGSDLGYIRLNYSKIKKKQIIN